MTPTDQHTAISAPPLGAEVLYRLTQGQADAVNRRRADAAAHTRLHPVPEVTAGHPGRTGHVLHTGNSVSQGDQYPAKVVRVFPGSGSNANLQVTLDGNDTLWATSVGHGDEPGRWLYNPAFAHPASVALHAASTPGSDAEADDRD